MIIKPGVKAAHTEKQIVESRLVVSQRWGAGDGRDLTLLVFARFIMHQIKKKTKILQFNSLAFPNTETWEKFLPQDVIKKPLNAVGGAGLNPIPDPMVIMSNFICSSSVEDKSIMLRHSSATKQCGPPAQPPCNIRVNLEYVLDWRGSMFFSSYWLIYLKCIDCMQGDRCGEITMNKTRQRFSWS